MAEKKKLTQKEAKIVLKRSGMFDSNTKGLPLPKKSDKKTIKAADKKSVKATAKERGFAKDKASRKEMKQQDVFYNKAGKEDLKSGQVTGASKANVSKSQSPSKPKVPVKPSRGGGGMRGGAGGSSRIFGSIK